MFCKKCGSRLKDGARFCQDCGAAVNERPQQPPQSQQPQYQPQNQLPTTQEGNTVAIVGFVFSFLIAIVGLICSIVGYNNSKKGAPYGGLALAGIIISAVSMGLAFIIMVSTPRYFFYYI